MESVNNYLKIYIYTVNLLFIFARFFCYVTIVRVCNFSCFYAIGLFTSPLVCKLFLFYELHDIVSLPFVSGGVCGRVTDLGLAVKREVRSF